MAYIHHSRVTHLSNRETALVTERITPVFQFRKKEKLKIVSISDTANINPIDNEMKLSFLWRREGSTEWIELENAIKHDRTNFRCKVPMTLYFKIANVKTAKEEIKKVLRQRNWKIPEIKDWWKFDYKLRLRIGSKVHWDIYHSFRSFQPEGVFRITNEKDDLLKINFDAVYSSQEQQKPQSPPNTILDSLSPSFDQTNSWKNFPPGTPSSASCPSSSFLEPRVLDLVDQGFDEEKKETEYQQEITDLTARVTKLENQVKMLVQIIEQGRINDRIANSKIRENDEDVNLDLDTAGGFVVKSKKGDRRYSPYEKENKDNSASIFAEDNFFGNSNLDIFNDQSLNFPLPDEFME